MLYNSLKLISFFIAVLLISVSPLWAQDPIEDPISDIGVTLEFPASAPTQTIIGYVFKVKNSGPNASEGTELQIQLPEKGELITHQTGQGTCAASPTDATVLVCQLGKIENAATVQVAVQWKTPNEEGTLTIVADANTLTSIDETTANDHVEGSTTVSEVVVDPMADLKFFVKPILSVSAGNVINYSMQVENSGPDAAVGTHLSIIIPRVGQYVSLTSEQGTCVIAQPDVIECDLQNLASGRVVKLGLRWKAPNEAATLRFVATVSGQAIDAHSENNSLDFETAVEAPTSGPNPGSSPAAPAGPENWACSLSLGASSAPASSFAWAMLLFAIPVVRMRGRK